MSLTPKAQIEATWAQVLAGAESVTFRRQLWAHILLSKSTFMALPLARSLADRPRPRYLLRDADPIPGESQSIRNPSAFRQAGGDCDDIATNTAGLLRAAGIQAVPVWFPNAEQPRHVACGIHTSTGRFVIDGTTRLRGFYRVG